MLCTMRPTTISMLIRMTRTYFHTTSQPAVILSWNKLDWLISCHNQHITHRTTSRSCFSQVDALMNLNRQGIAQISAAAPNNSTQITPQSTSARRINSSGNTILAAAFRIQIKFVTARARYFSGYFDDASAAGGYCFWL